MKNIRIIRPMISETTYNKVIKIANLPIDVPFDKTLVVALDKLQKRRGK